MAQVAGPWSARGSAPGNVPGGGQELVTRRARLLDPGGASGHGPLMHEVAAGLVRGLELAVGDVDTGGLRPAVVALERRAVVWAVRVNRLRVRGVLPLDVA